MYQFKAKRSKIENNYLCLINISKDFTFDNTEKKAGLKGTVKVFSVDYNAIDTNNDLDFQRYLMKET